MNKDSLKKWVDFIWHLASIYCVGK